MGAETSRPENPARAPAFTDLEAQVPSADTSRPVGVVEPSAAEVRHLELKEKSRTWCATQPHCDNTIWATAEGKRERAVCCWHCDGTIWANAEGKRERAACCWHCRVIVRDCDAMSCEHNDCDLAGDSPDFCPTCGPAHLECVTHKSACTYRLADPSCRFLCAKHAGETLPPLSDEEQREVDVDVVRWAQGQFATQ